MNNALSTLFLIVVLLEKELSATITQGPSNTVADIGEQVKLNCTANTAIGFWYLSKNGVTTDEVIIAGPGCTVSNPAFAYHYTVESIGGGTTCNLIVSNISMEQAGVYRCSDGTAQLWFIILTVTDSSPVITVNNTNDTWTAVEKESVIIECLLNHNGSVAPAPTLWPYFYWTNSSGNVSSSYNSTADKTAVSQITVTAGRQNIMPYTCHVYFKLMPQTTPNYASNIPRVSSIASSATIQVLYYPEITNLTSSVSIKDKCVYKQENLTCTADANPAAQYEWLDLSTNAMTSGTVKSITSGGQYRCIAYNYIRTMRHNATDTATEDNCYPVTENNMTITCTKDSCNCTGFQPLEITCEVYSLPKPTYLWLYNGFEYSSDQTFQVEFDGDYSCTANSSFGTNSSKATKSTRVFNCTPAPPISKAWIFVPVWVIVCWILGFLCFPIYYKVPRRKDTYNQRFPVLMRMLPCMNKASSAPAHGGSVGWIILYIVMVTFVGLFAIPVMFLTVQCSKPNKKGQNAITTESGEIKAEDQPQNDYEDINFSGYQELTPKTIQANSYAQLTDLVPEKTASAESKEKGDSEFSEELADKSVLKQNENANSS